VLSAVRTIGTPAATTNAGTAGLAEIARQLLKEADARQQYFPGLVSNDPVWPILLDLYIHMAEGRRVCISDACIAARVPSTTALRYIGELVAHGAVERVPDPHDRRRTHLRLATRTFVNMSRYLDRIVGIDVLAARVETSRLPVDPMLEEETAKYQPMCG
jgi:hypothetical protein